MGRIVAIDYGLRRSGIAVTDPLKIIANSLTTVDSSELIGFLEGYFKREKVEKVIVGLPKQMNNEPSESMPFVEEFVLKFRSKFTDIPVEYLDERFTSKLAVQAMVQGGVKKMDRRNKALIDNISATILLQSYMEGLINRK